MSDRLDAHLALLRTGELAAYYSEILEFETAFFNRPETPDTLWVREDSAWASREARGAIYRINNRYAIEEDDPRVYSINAYGAELWCIAREYEIDLKAMYAMAEEGREPSPSIFDRECWQRARLASLIDRHFYGCSTWREQDSQLSTIPKLWYWCHSTADLVHKYCTPKIPSYYQLKDKEHFRSKKNAEVQRAYRMLHVFKVRWAPAPPYPDLPVDQAIDELFRIANRLEQEEAQRLSDLWLGAPPGNSDTKGSGANSPASSESIGKKPSRKRGRPSDTDPKMDKSIATAWATKTYANHQQLADALKKDLKQVKDALERDRKRNPKKSPTE